MLRQLSTDSSDDDGGGGNNGVRCSMTAQNSSRSSADSSYMENSHSRMGIRIHIRIGRPEHPIQFQFRQFPLRPERQNAGRAQEVIQLPSMQ
jgi:hypothetical protein